MSYLQSYDHDYAESREVEYQERRELERENDASDAHNRHLHLVDLRNMGETIFLELGRELYEFERDRCYKALDFDSFNSYLASSGVDISTRTAYRLKAVYKKYVLDLGLAPLSLVAAGYTKLSMIAPQVDSSNAADWLAKAETLSRADIIRELKDGDPNYQEPPIIRFLDDIRIDYNIGAIAEHRVFVSKLKDVKMVQQGKYVTITGTLVEINSNHLAENASNSPPRQASQADGRLADE